MTETNLLTAAVVFAMLIGEFALIFLVAGLYRERFPEPFWALIERAWDGLLDAATWLEARTPGGKARAAHERAEQARQQATVRDLGIHAATLWVDREGRTRR